MANISANVPEQLRTRMTTIAKLNHRSFNAELVIAMDEYVVRYDVQREIFARRYQQERAGGWTTADEGPSVIGAHESRAVIPSPHAQDNGALSDDRSTAPD